MADLEEYLFDLKLKIRRQEDVMTTTKINAFGDFCCGGMGFEY